MWPVFWAIALLIVVRAVARGHALWTRDPDVQKLRRRLWTI